MSEEQPKQQQQDDNKFKGIKMLPNGLPEPMMYLKDVPICFADEKKLQSIRETEQMEFDSSDVMMCGYMRSGTTWHRQMLWLIMNNADIEAAKAKNQFERILYLEKGWFIPGEKMPLARLKEMSSPRTLFTHLPYQVVGDRIKNTGMKCIYIVRNPKDIITSLYYASRTFAPMIGPNFDIVPWPLLLAYASSDTAEMGNLFDHFRGFWEQKGDPNILFITYEESKKDHAGAIRKMANFLGKDLTDKQVEDIKEFTSMSSMKDTSVKDRQGGFFKLAEQKFAFVRKGQIGDWKNHFKVAENERFDAYMAEKMKGMEDLKFIFEE